MMSKVKRSQDESVLYSDRICSSVRRLCRFGQHTHTAVCKKIENSGSFEAEGASPAGGAQLQGTGSDRWKGVARVGVTEDVAEHQGDQTRCKERNRHPPSLWKRWELEH